MADLEDAVEWQEITAPAPKEKLKQLKGDINLLIAKLEVGPQRLRDLSDISNEGWMYMTKSGKLSWKKFYVQLVGDVISFYMDPMVRSRGEVFYFYFSPNKYVSKELFAFTT